MVRLEVASVAELVSISKVHFLLGGTAVFSLGRRPQEDQWMLAPVDRGFSPGGRVLNEKSAFGCQFRCRKATSERKVWVNVGPLLLAVSQSGTAQGALFLSPKPLLERSDLVRACIPSNWVVRSHG